LNKKKAPRFTRVNRIKGHYDARKKSFGIVVSEFNEYLTNQLLDGALDALVRHGAREKDIHVVYVPGAFELPLAVRQLLSVKKLHAVITLAVVIRGETKHFDQVVVETAQGLREIAEETRIPVMMGMIPAENVEQAIARVGIKHANKGREWASAAVEMASLMEKLSGKKGKR
jgi:6,7-dimethyl-8-ribityllumazine synthase